MHIYKKSTKNNKLFVFRTYEQPPINSLLPKTLLITKTMMSQDDQYIILPMIRHREGST